MPYPLDYGGKPWSFIQDGGRFSEQAQSVYGPFLLETFSNRRFRGDGDAMNRVGLGIVYCRSRSVRAKIKYFSRHFTARLVNTNQQHSECRKHIYRWWMASFKEFRDLLVLSYDSKIISDEEFLILHEVFQSKNPDFDYYICFWNKREFEITSSAT